MTRESAIETLERLANFEGIIPYMLMHSVTIQNTLHYATEKLKAEDLLSAVRNAVAIDWGEESEGTNDNT